MDETKYHRITDWNWSVEGVERRMSFEAAFDLVPTNAMIIRGRVVDSGGVAVLRSMDPVESYGTVEIYQKWNPSEDLAKIVKTLESNSMEGLPVYFASPMCELNIEIQPTFPGQNILGVVITMAGKVAMLDNYRWLDSGYLGAGLLCEAEPLLDFFRRLQQDCSTLIDKTRNKNG